MAYLVDALRMQKLLGSVGRVLADTRTGTLVAAAVRTRYFFLFLERRARHRACSSALRALCMCTSVSTCAFSSACVRVSPSFGAGVVLVLCFGLMVLTLDHTLARRMVVRAARMS